MSIATRLGKLEKELGAGDGDRCPACPRWLTPLTYRDDEAPPEVPRCEACGREVDALIIHEVTVAERGEAEAFYAAHPDHRLEDGRAARELVEVPGREPAPTPPPEPQPVVEAGPAPAPEPRPTPPAPDRPRVASTDPPGPAAPPPVPRDGPGFWDALRRDLGDGW
jgi:hypothetical protein